MFKVKYILATLLVMLSIVSVAQVGKYEPNLHARDTLETDANFIVAMDTLVPILEVSYHQWSADGVTWSREYTLGDRYIRLSNDVKHTWVEVDLLDRYWVLGTDSAIYVNTDYANRILVDTTSAPENFNIFTTGDIGGDYFFLGADSLTHTNMYNGGVGSDGYILTFSGDTAIWQPIGSGFGEVNIMQNAGTRGMGVYDNKVDSMFNMRNIASSTSMLTVTLNEADSVIDLDLALKTITAGTALTGGGSLENDLTLNLYVPELPSSTVIDSAADWLILYDVSAAAHYKVHPEDLLAVLGLYTAGDGLSLTGNSFSLDTPATVSDTSTNRVGANDHSHQLRILELTSVEDVTDTPSTGQYLQWNGTAWVTNTPAGGTGSSVDLYVNSVLVESEIEQLNVIGSGGTTAAYSGSGGVTISTSTCNFGTQSLTSGADTLNVTSGVHGVLDISSNTTIRIVPTATCNTGNITVETDASGYTIQFLSSYPIWITPCITHTSGVITTTAGASIDVYSYWFDGERIIINGTQDYVED